MATIRGKVLNEDKSDKSWRNDVKSLCDLLKGVPINTTDECIPIDTPRLVFNSPFSYSHKNWFLSDIVYRKLYSDDRGYIGNNITAIAEFHRKNYWFDVFYMPDVYLHLKVLNALSLNGYDVWYRLYKEKEGVKNG